MKKQISTGRIILIAIIIESVLILLQFLSIGFGTSGKIDTAYIQSRGFFIFQILGFFAYAITAFYLCRKHTPEIVKMLVILVITGAVIELGFYIISAAQYRGVYLYSITDKLIGAVTGWIVGLYSTRWKNIDIPQ